LQPPLAFAGIDLASHFAVRQHTFDLFVNSLDFSSRTAFSRIPCAAGLVSADMTSRALAIAIGQRPRSRKMTGVRAGEQSGGKQSDQ
jgi:hypothetical protein